MKTFIQRVKSVVINWAFRYWLAEITFWLLLPVAMWMSVGAFLKPGLQNVGIAFVATLALTLISYPAFWYRNNRAKQDIKSEVLEGSMSLCYFLFGVISGMFCFSMLIFWAVLAMVPM